MAKSILLINLKITKADKADAEEILALQKLAYQSEAERYGDYSIPPLLQTLTEIEAEFDTHVFLKAVLDNAIIGSVRALHANNTWHVGRLVVHPQHRRKGIGGVLLGEIEKYTSPDRFEIFTGSESLETIRLYERHGYQKCKVERLSDKVLLVYMEKHS